MRTTHLGLAAAAALALLVTGCASAQPGGTTAPTTTADPAPTEIAPTETAPPAPTDDGDDDAAGTPIPDDRLAGLDVMDAVSTDGAAAMWAEPGTSLAVFIGGSGSSACVPAPESAEVEDGTIVVEFEAPDLAAISCTADFRVYGWTFPVEVDASGPVDVRVEGLSPADDQVVELTVAPEAVLP
ncbi:hypothetical protein OVA14_01365 [Agrococcus sp. SL85]|uniref:hypothetical protein n=1 Tax=Agrococcus sp. SL85 TaxID=2995141 RepID=UPI00226CB4A0|nr:hypothetical protein [Agrococcus sp. SL85]WAC66468.1 hypothetical protein OVA14_01365 [Agrococcus sp. SL85]